jgi:hypothetical protein
MRRVFYTKRPKGLCSTNLALPLTREPNPFYTDITGPCFSIPSIFASSHTLSILIVVKQTHSSVTSHTLLTTHSFSYQSISKTPKKPPNHITLSLNPAQLYSPTLLTRNDISPHPPLIRYVRLSRWSHRTSTLGISQFHLR